MYCTGIGRVSGAGHLAVQFPKTAAIVAGCIAAAGIYSNISSAPSVSQEDILRYCNHRTSANLMSLPPEVQTRVDQVCGCVHDACQRP
jgi:hypothetical protein